MAGSEALRNVEVKARVGAGALAGLVRAAAELAADEGRELRQRDVFFPLGGGGDGGGRLKLRRCGHEAQLIWYARDDVAGAKLSQYRLVQLQPQQAEPLEQVLSAALGSLPPLCKTRRLFLVGQTRIHVDEVQDLGHFMELEVVLRPDQTIQDGQKIADLLLLKLGIPTENLISGAYMDLLMKQQNKQSA